MWQDKEYTHECETLSLREWAAKLGCKENVLYSYLLHHTITEAVAWYTRPQSERRRGRQRDPRPRHYTVARLRKEDGDVFREISRVVTQEGGDLYAAMEEIAELVKNVTIDDLPHERLKPIRLGIPIELNRAIKRKACEFGRPSIRILIAAAERYVADKKNVAGYTPPIDFQI